MKRKSRVNEIQDMLKAEPSDVFLNYSLGLEFVADENFILAENAFNKTIALQGDYIPAYFQKGKLLELQNKIGDAIEAYKLGLKFAQLQKNNKAVNELSEAIFMLED